VSEPRVCDLSQGMRPIRRLQHDLGRGVLQRHVWQVLSKDLQCQQRLRGADLLQIRANPCARRYRHLLDWTSLRRYTHVCIVCVLVDGNVSLGAGLPGEHTDWGDLRWDAKILQLELDLDHLCN